MGKRLRLPTTHEVLRFIGHSVTPRGFMSFFAIAIASLGLAILAGYLSLVILDSAKPKHPRVIVHAAARALTQATGVTVSVDMLNPGYYLGESFAAYEQSLRTRGLGTKVPAPPLPPRDQLSHVIISNYPPGRTLYVGYIPAQAVAGRWSQIDPQFMLSGRINEVPGFVVPFSMSSNSETTFHEVASMFDAFVRGNAEQFPELTVDQLMTATRQGTAVPFNNLPGLLKGILIAVGLIGLLAVWIFSLNLTLYGREIDRAMIPMRIEYRRYREQGLTPTPPSDWQCFWSDSLRGYSERYIKALKREVEEIRRQERHARRERKRNEQTTLAIEAFDQQMKVLLAELGPIETMSLQQREDITMMQDPTLGLEARQRAYIRVHTSLKISTAPIVTVEDDLPVEPSPRMPNEELLLDRALGVDTTDWPEQESEQFSGLISQYEAALGDQDPSLRISYLQAALEVDKQVRIKIGQQRTAGEQQPATSHCRLEEKAETFDIKAWLPNRVDHEHAAVILVWGLIKPGRGSQMFVGRRTAQEEQLRTAVVCKLGKKYNAGAYEHALHWLVQHGVVVETKKRGRHSYGLNYDEAQVMGDGLKIVQYIKQFAFAVRGDLARA